MNIRSTFQARYAQMGRNAARLGSAMASAQEQAITGMAVVRGSDAPEAARRIQQLQASLASQATHQANATDAESRLDTADSALGSISDALASLHELSVQLSSGTYSSAERTAGAAEAQATYETVLGLANTKQAGRTLFGGAATDADPFAADGSYQGADSAALSRVSASMDATVGWVGSETFKEPVDVFEAMKGVIEALEGDDGDALAGWLEALESARQQVDALRAQVGVQTNLVTDARELAASAELQLTADLSGLTEIDTVESYTRVAELEAALEAALALLAKVGTGQGMFARI
jgi:flagellar hook-associated protein 3 FlgL